ncbi:iron donor protein CyaY [soil metagenome]
MTEQEYDKLVDDEMIKIYDDLTEKYGEEVDIEKGDGIMKIILIDDTQLIVSRQAPVKQIWLAAKHGGYHFIYNEEDKKWRDSKTKEDLMYMINETVDKSFE